MYRKIMVPLDGSKTSTLGLKEAIKLAKEQGAKLLLLNVIDTSIIKASFDTYTNLNDLVALLRRDGEKTLEEGLTLAKRSGMRVEKRLIEAIEQRTSEVIVDEARRSRSDLIVMGTHGRRGFNRVFLGSTAEGVARSAAVPVMLVRPKLRSPA